MGKIIKNKLTDEELNAIHVQAISLDRLLQRGDTLKEGELDTMAGKYLDLLDPESVIKLVDEIRWHREHPLVTPLNKGEIII